MMVGFWIFERRDNYIVLYFFNIIGILVIICLIIFKIIKLESIYKVVLMIIYRCVEIKREDWLNVLKFYKMEVKVKSLFV